MRSETIRECMRLWAKQYKVDQIALVLGLTIDQVRYAVEYDREGNKGQMKEGSPDELIDGEPMAQRIKRITSEIRSGRLVIERTR